MQKLYRQNFGLHVAIAIEDSNPIELQERYFSFYNHEGTNGELHWLTPTLAYFWSTQEKFEHALIYSSLFQILNSEQDTKKYKGRKNGLMCQACELASKRYEEITYLEFVPLEQPKEHYRYKVGYLEFQTPNLNYYGECVPVDSPVGM